MALWQYLFRIIPKEDLKQIGDDICISQEIYDYFKFWQNRLIDEEFFVPLTASLSKNKSWSRDIELYGSEQSTCVEIIRENNIIYEVIVRIDYTFDYTKFLNQLIEFCSLNNLLLLDENNCILILNAMTITTHINLSPQYNKLNKLNRNEENKQKKS